VKRAALLLAMLGVFVVSARDTRGDVWQRALDTTDATRDRYAKGMREGDHLAMQANARGLSRARTASLVDQALRAYRDAATARPEQAEPYFRIATVLDSFYIDCRPHDPGAGQPRTCPPPTRPDLARVLEAVEALDAFEARAPLDPRVHGIRFDRAIHRTKLVDAARSPEQARAYLEGALADYRALLERPDGVQGLVVQPIWGNLAETYMMLGRLDEAIETYQTAIRLGADTSTYYGLAVALDRDERTAEALDVIRGQGPRAFEQFKLQYHQQRIFFVPRGEEFYYLALASEALGYTTDAITQWRLFLQSGAHPPFQARAKAHLDALLARPKPPAPTTRLRAPSPFR